MTDIISPKNWKFCRYEWSEKEERKRERKNDARASEDNQIGGISRFSCFPFQCQKFPNRICVCILEWANSIIREIDNLSWKWEARLFYIAFTALLSSTMALKIFMISSNLDAKAREFSIGLSVRLGNATELHNFWYYRKLSIFSSLRLERQQ